MAGKRSSAKKQVNTASLPPVPTGVGLVVYEGASGQVPIAFDEG